jgi:hypothetical protein
MAQLKKLAFNAKPTTFLTLTVNPSTGTDPADRARALANAWRICVKRARRKFTKHPIEYLAVFEKTKKGEPHLHILLRAPIIPHAWLSNTMNELIQAPIVDIRRVHSGSLAASYVAKYVGKGPKAFGTLKRYWSTPAFDPMADAIRERKRANKGQWIIIRESLETFAQQWAFKPGAVWWESDSEIVVLDINVRDGPAPFEDRWAR